MAKALIPALILMISSVMSSTTATSNNETFCSQGVSLFADSLVRKLEFQDSTLLLSVGQTRFSGDLMHFLGSRLGERKIATYQGAATGGSTSQVLQVSVENSALKLRGIMQGLFRRGKIERTFAVSGGAVLSETDGRLLQSIRQSPVSISDTLSFSQAKAAAGLDTFLSPQLPPTLHQRLIEPGLIFTITGTLVYLFFAAR